MAAEAPGPARLEAFSDGVIAVIITVMVLEIKVPHADGLTGLREVAPSLAIYLLSFSFTGVYWLNHQHLLHRTQKAAHSMQCANLGFLFCLSLLPLSTAYVVDKHLSGFAVAVYSASLLIIALSFLWLRLEVHAHLRRRSAIAEEDLKGLRNHLSGLIFFAVTIPAAFFYPRSVLLANALFTLTWVFPNLSWKQAKQASE
jgi:TMEM175 potassium channel family protein